MTDLEASIVALCQRARAAARKLAPAPIDRRRAACLAIADELGRQRAVVLAANEADVAAARAKGTSEAMLDRLRLDERRLAALEQATREIAALADPVWTTLEERTRPNGLRVRRVRVPIGVLAMIYEARPNVTVEAATLALYSGNAIVLRGGSEAQRSNEALAAVVGAALERAGISRDAVALLPTTAREAIGILLRQTDTVDLAIPRGGEALIRHVTEVARVPVVQHYKGVCHMFLDEGCAAEMAERLVADAKLSRPAVCNALECLLVHASHLAPGGLAGPLFERLAARGCELRVDDAAYKIAPQAKLAVPSDYGQEFLEPVLAVRTVASLDEALAHIATYGSGHTEAIVTPTASHAERFRREVDAACIVVNASTRFHDGGELGLGAELGIATSRLHWRGAMGLEALTTMKWIVDGDGQVRH